MIIVRFVGILVAMLAAFVIALGTGIELINVVSMIAFILVVDSLICRFISYIYLKATYVEMEKVQQEINERERRGKDSSPE